MLDLRPHPSHAVLLGHSADHAFDRVIWRRHASESAAAAAIAQLAHEGSVDAARSVVLRVDEQPDAFSQLRSGGGGAWLDTAPATGSGLPSSVPYLADPTAQADAWKALHEAPSAGGMVAMNLIRIPAAVEAQYAAFASHFATLPGKYGMCPVLIATVPDPPEESVVFGSLAEGHGAGAPTLLAAVRFPSSRVFASAWADEVIATSAYPLRAQMYEDGFDHIWLRCDE